MTKKTQSVFRDNSIRDFSAALNRWVEPLGKAIEFLYYGSYFYDIYGNPYTDSNIDDGVYKDEQVRDVINSALFDMKISLTECIQKRYLKSEDKILHLFFDSGCEKFESIPINTFKFDEEQSAKQYPSNFDLSVLIADGIGEESSQYAEIKSSFKKHFQIIKLTNSHIYFFPTVLELIDNTINIVNVTTIICKNELSEDSMNFIQAGLTYCSDGLIKDTVQFLNNKALYESIKSAKAAIMSRNMSHNIGSHVMAYLKQQLSSATSILNSGQVLTNLITDVEQYSSDEIEKIGLPFLVGLGRFFGYLQERQDYIATISTDHIPYGAPVNLKDAIYDELNPDLRYLRHKQESDNKAQNRPTNILLNYIAKSEGFSRENMDDGFQSEKDIRFGYIAYVDGKYKTFGLDSTEVKNTDTDAFASNNAALTQMRKINFSLPGGLVGRQAIFSIVENLIRNAAKHGDTSSAKNLDFTLDIIDGSKIRKEKQNKGIVGDWDEGKRVNEKIWRKLYEKADDLDDIYLLTITDNLPCSIETVNVLKEGLYEDFVNPQTGQITTANKGIKEIRISAAWLRSETDESRYLKYPFIKDDANNKEKPLPMGEEYMDNDPDNIARKIAPLVAVELSNEGHLRYIVCIPKNKTVAIVSEVKKDDGTLVASFNKEVLAKFNKLQEQNKNRWIVLTDSELKHSKTSYSFILCPDDDDAFETLRPYTSNRLCQWKEIEDGNKNKDEEAILLDIYKLFTGLSDKSEVVLIADDKAKSANLAREKASGKKAFDKIKFDIDDANVEYKYLYLTHYSTEKNYVEFFLDNIEKGDRYDFIEGITGDNSSDRLIRREKLDEKWYYSHLYAMQKKVAIIDERIFKIVHYVDENRFVGDKTVSVEELKQYSSQISIKDLKKKIRPTLDKEGKFALIKVRTIDDLAQIVKEIPMRFVGGIMGNKLVNEDKIVIGNSYLTPYYHGKAVDIYTIIKNAEGKMALAGCLNENTKFDKEKNTFINTFKILATFEHSDNGGYEIKPVSEEYKKVFADRYDYISIHQGILDKIYDNFKIKKNEEAMCHLTECIHNRFMKDKSVYGKYLPRFIIHSGRAKPPKDDMPQQQPFVQYSAIENAVKDCKLMLVELLDFAKYEPTDS